MRTPKEEREIIAGGYVFSETGERSALLNTACGESERERCICEILLAAAKAKENEINIEKDSYGFAGKGN